MNETMSLARRYMTNSNRRRRLTSSKNLYTSTQRLGPLPATEPYDNVCMKGTTNLCLICNGTDFNIVFEAAKDATMRAKDTVSKEVFATMKKMDNTFLGRRQGQLSAALRWGRGAHRGGEGAGCHWLL